MNNNNRRVQTKSLYSCLTISYPSVCHTDFHSFDEEQRAHWKCKQSWHYRNDLTIYEFDLMFAKMREYRSQRLNMYHTRNTVSGSIVCNSCLRKYQSSTVIYIIRNISYQSEQEIIIITTGIGLLIAQQVIVASISVLVCAQYLLCICSIHCCYSTALVWLWTLCHYTRHCRHSLCLCSGFATQSHKRRCKYTAKTLR